MAALKYRDEHNRIGFLEKPKGSTDYHQVIDFLLNSHIRYAIVTDPLIYDSLITQFWSTASLRSSELGPPAIVATIDGTPYTITESLVRSQLQLHDEGGIVDMPIPDIFLGMDNLGYPTEGKLTFHKNKFSPQWRFLIHTLLHCLSTKSGSWDQFGSPLAIALICLCEGKKYNWSRYIFTGMVNNINNSKKFLMFPRFLQMILDIETRNTKPYHAFRLTSKMFANMRLNFHGDHMPLVAAMLPPPQAAIAAGTSGEAAQTNPQTAHEPVTDPMHPTASSHDHGSTSPRPTPTTLAAQLNEPVSKPPRPIPTSPSAQVNQQGPSSDPHVESSSKDNDSNPDPNVADDPLGGPFFLCFSFRVQGRLLMTEDEEQDMDYVDQQPGSSYLLLDQLFVVPASGHSPTTEFPPSPPLSSDAISVWRRTGWRAKAARKLMKRTQAKLAREQGRKGRRKGKRMMDFENRWEDLSLMTSTQEKAEFIRLGMLLLICSTETKRHQSRPGVHQSTFSDNYTPANPKHIHLTAFSKPDCSFGPRTKSAILYQPVAPTAAAYQDLYHPGGSTLAYKEDSSSEVDLKMLRHKSLHSKVI
ncbi:hypothetical protein Tco_0555723 [Tanacetum coccineum]